MRTFLAVTATLMFFSACSVDAPSEATTTGPSTESLVSDPQVDVVQLLRRTTSFAYDAYSEPSAMLRSVDVAIVGEVVSVDSALIRDELDGQGAIMVGLRPLEIWKDDPRREPGTLFYWNDRPKNIGVELYREALPVGTQVVLFGFDTEANTGTRFSEGDPGVAHYTPAPQGLYLPSVDGTLVNVWGENGAGIWADIDSVDELRRASLRGVE